LCHQIEQEAAEGTEKEFLFLVTLAKDAADVFGNVLGHRGASLHCE